MINEKIVIEDKTADYNEAYIETYFWQESEELYLGQKRPAIVICPGGAYGMTSDREAEAIAVRFMGMGYHAVVLRYSVAPARYPVALRQLAKTVALLRKNSEKWHIEKDKIIVSGFSAGGHLAASLGVFWNTEELAKITEMDNQMIRPDGMILNYPVITSGEFGHEESFRNLLGDRYEELKDQDYSETVLQSILYHHENYDGSGYPSNLSGDSIPLGARILRVCDVYAALISDRPYRKAFDVSSVIELMIDEIKNFDMEVFLAFQRVVHDNK